MILFRKYPRKFRYKEQNKVNGILTRSIRKSMPDYGGNERNSVREKHGETKSGTMAAEGERVRGLSENDFKTYDVIDTTGLCTEEEL